MPRVSVVITTFNRAVRVTHAIDSVLAQTRQAEEIVVVDDGSSDNTVEIIHAHYPRVNLLRQENSGVSSARNPDIQPGFVAQTGKSGMCMFRPRCCVTGTGAGNGQCQVSLP